MSIYNLCSFSKCRTIFSLEEKTCPKCGNKIIKGKQKFKVDIMIDGKRVTKTVENITQAKDLNAGIKTDVIRGEFVDRRKDMRFIEVWERYHNAKSTIPRMPLYEGYFEHLFKKWENQFLRSIEPRHVELLINDLRRTKTKRGRNYSEATIKSIITFLSSLFNYARKVLRQKIDNPCDYIEKPRETRTPVIPLSTTQKKDLMIALDEYKDNQVSNMVRFILATGLRRGEVFKLNWSDVDFEGRRLLILQAKSGRNEVIPLSDTALVVLEHQKREHGDKTLVFPSPKTGRQYNNFSKAWNTIKKAAGIPAATTIHKLRHQFASDLVNTGASLYIVGKLLRHSKTETTKIYAHLIDETLREAVKKIE